MWLIVDMLPTGWGESGGCTWLIVDVHSWTPLTAAHTGTWGVAGTSRAGESRTTLVHKHRTHRAIALLHLY